MPAWSLAAAQALLGHPAASLMAAGPEASPGEDGGAAVVGGKGAAESEAHDQLSPPPLSPPVLPPLSSSRWAGHAAGLLLAVPAVRVNHVALQGSAYGPGEAVPGSASVVVRYLRNAYLWDEVRVKGGAYGANAGLSRLTGVASFSSYRDPSVVATLDTFQSAAAFLRSTYPLPSEEVAKAVVGAIGELDAPRSPQGAGYAAFTRFLLGLGEEDRQAWRSEVLATTPEDFLAFADRLERLALLDHTGQPGGSVENAPAGAVFAAVGSEAALTAAAATLAERGAPELPIRRVLEK